MNKTQYYLKFCEMQFYFLLHKITIPFVRLHTWATDKNNQIDDLLLEDPYTLILQQKLLEKQIKKNGLN